MRIFTITTNDRKDIPRLIYNGIERLSEFGLKPTYIALHLADNRLVKTYQKRYGKIEITNPVPNQKKVWIVMAHKFLTGGYSVEIVSLSPKGYVWGIYQIICKEK